MSINNTHSDGFYLELLDQLAQGKITRDDLYLLQKRALDDPFIADALEGFIDHDNEDHTAIIDRIKPSRHVHTENKIRRMWWPIAASILLIAVSGVLYFDSTRTSDFVESESSDSSEIPILAQGKTEEANDRINALLEPLEEKEDSNILSKDLSKKSKKTANPAEKNLQPKEDVVSQKSKKTSEKLTHENEPLDESSVDEEIASVPIIRGSSSRVQEVQIDGVPIQTKTSIELNSLKGRVLDRNKNVLIGAQVVVTDALSNSSVTSTDMDGNFNFDKLDTGEVELKIAYTGYEPYVMGNMYIEPGQNLMEVEMVEGALLDEIVVLDYAQAKKKSSIENSYKQDVNALPEMGYEELELFVHREKVVMQSDFGSVGYVLLQFLILENGEIDQIKIIESTTTSRNSEATRIIKDAGKWKLKEGIQAPYLMTYRMDF